MRQTKAFLASTAIVATVFFVVVDRYRPPSPVTDPEPGEFSAVQAGELLVELFGDRRPHPTGTPANDRLRERIIGHLRQIGLFPSVQVSYACNPSGTCAEVRNVVARLRGAGDGQAVLVAVHYDSVGAGPGAADDGVSVVSALEIARILRVGGARRNDIIFLIDDGEEQGLLGAEAFCARHPWAKDVRAVVNLEARGTSGASLMFETNPGNERIVKAVGTALSRPATNSVYYSIYQHLPNDTDFTVFKRYGMLGVNFAFVGDPAHYHTPLDNDGLVDRGTIQHQGQNALQAVRALADADLDALRTVKDGTYFDLFTAALVRWQAGWTPWIALLSVLFLVVTIIFLRHEGVLRLSTFSLGVVEFLCCVVATALLAWMLLWIFRSLTPPGIRWVASAGALKTAFLALPLAVISGLSLLFRRATFAGTWSGSWLVWSVLGAALAFVLPGAAYPFLVVAFTAGLFGFLWGWLHESDQVLRGLALVVPLVVGASLIFPLAWLFYDGLGVGVLPFVSVLVALVLGGLLPLTTRGNRRGVMIVCAASGVIVAASFVIASVSEPWSSDIPRPLSIVLHADADSGDAEWLVSARNGPPPATMARFFENEAARPYEFSPEYRAWRGRAKVRVEGPDISFSSLREENGNRVITVELRSRRQADAGGIEIRSKRVVSVRVDGVLVREDLLRLSKTGSRPDRWSTYQDRALRGRSVRFDIAYRGVEPLELYAWDLSYGLPAEAQALVSSRPSSAVPIDAGDRTFVTKMLRVE